MTVTKISKNDLKETSGWMSLFSRLPCSEPLQHLTISYNSSKEREEHAIVCRFSPRCTELNPNSKLRMQALPALPCTNRSR